MLGCVVVRNELISSDGLESERNRSAAWLVKDSLQDP